VGISPCARDRRPRRGDWASLWPASFSVEPVVVALISIESDGVRVAVAPKRDRE